MSNPAPLPDPNDDPWNDDDVCDDEDDDDDPWEDDLWGDDDEDDDWLLDRWMAHADPGRRFSFGMWLCTCTVCIDALRAEVAVRPGTVMILKTTRGKRIIVTAGRLLDAATRGRVELVCPDPRDIVREVFVAHPLLQRRGGAPPA